MRKREKEAVEQLLSEIFPQGEKTDGPEALTDEEREAEAAAEASDDTVQKIRDEIEGLVQSLFKEMTGLEPVKLQWYQNGLTLKRGDDPAFFITPPELGALIDAANKFTYVISKHPGRFEELESYEYPD